jgi:hypothetical protein
MADLGYSQTKINDIEVAGDAPVTADLFTKLGGAINFLIDTRLRIEEFTTPGATTWTAPDFTTFVYLLGCGGGGAGSGCVAEAGLGGDRQPGAGGSATIPFLIRAPVTPAVTYSLTIGAGGLGATGTSGGAGGNTIFDTTRIFYGAPGAVRYVESTAANLSALTVAFQSIPHGPFAPSAGVSNGTLTGPYDYTVASYSNFGAYRNGQILIPGGYNGSPSELPAMASPYHNTVAAPGAGSSHGFGGGTGLGAGGAGGATSTDGVDAAPTSYGAGGGGAGGGSGLTPLRAGGDGAGGFLSILYYDTP